MFQSTWLMLLQLNQQWSCTYNPNGPRTRDQAQAQCNEASRASADNGVLKSFDAAHDITLFLGRHSCNSNEARHLGKQLIEFGRLAHDRMFLTERMPSPDSPAGLVYARMFENCARQSPDNEMDGWCGCYAQTIYRLKPAPGVLEYLSRNPFVDGRTYMQWVAQNLPGGRAVYECTDKFPFDDRRLYRAPRTTACLVDKRSLTDGTQLCTYRAAWGEFSRTDQVCRADINSREWGYREVSCTDGGRVTSREEPREWKDGFWLNIDYENPVSETFVPSLPSDAKQKQPLSVRFLKREAPGLLKEISLQRVTNFNVPMKDPRVVPLLDADVRALSEEGALMLACTYNDPPAVRVRRYWYEKIPAHVAGGRLNKSVAPHPFDQIRGAATTCSAKFPSN
jgi:hypothetical protein